MSQKVTVSDDPRLVHDAAAFATGAHAGQFRKGGTNVPYITHPRRVRERLSGAGVTDASVLAAALLHDTVEDTSATMQDIRDRFGNDVARLVGWLTQDKGQTRRQYAESFRKADPQACVVKVADRLDNMLDWEAIDPDYKPVYAAEGLFLLAVIHQNKRLRHLRRSEREALRRLSRELNDVCAEALWGPAAPPDIDARSAPSGAP